MSRIARPAGLAGLFVTSLVILPGAPAVADPSDWCTTSPAPCIVSVTRDGVPVSSGNATWQVDLFEFTPLGHDVQWNLKQSGAYELADPTGRWEVTVDMGTIVPRVIYGTGRHGEVTRIDDGDGTYRVVSSAEPTLVASGCDSSPYPWPCETTAESQAYRLAAQVSDMHRWRPRVQREAFYGVDFWTNIEVTSFPPGVRYDDATGTATMSLEFGAPHFETDGSTIYRGHFEALLPNDFLHENFYIPDPRTTTPDSLAVAGGGPISSTTVTKSTPSSPMEIEVADMTFSIRKLRVRTGTVVPTRPSEVRATRIGATAGKVGFNLSKPRGAKVKGYQARCVPRHGSKVTAKRARNKSPVRVGNLTRGKPYTCRVRALSKVGPGPWSGKAQLPGRP